ncbi:MAG: hypothetical protein CL927_15440 [Deltaproteobacteria bacterium]|nr:hypothetical protein [Deltaproteobacteria bacterium]HCH62268.1 hypothetical protein [Deltaproteobacteria bacterium]
MSECTVSLPAGTDIQPHITPNAVICLAPGRYPGALRVDVPVTIQASSGATLDAGGRGPVLHVAEHGIRVRLAGLTITGGDAEFGAGLLVDTHGEVSLDDCEFVGNTPGRGGGAAIGATHGRLWMRNVRTAGAQDVVFGGVAHVAGESAQLRSDVGIRDGARVALRGGSVGQLTVRGTTTRQPEVVLEGVQTGTIENHPTVPGTIIVRP